MTKQEIIQVLMKEFRHFGYNALTLSQISKVTGLGKASLYHHFPNGKEEMAIEVLRMANEWIKNELILNLQNEINVDLKFKIILEKLNIFYYGGENYCLLDVMSTGNNSREINKEIELVLARLLSVFEKTAIEAGYTQKQSETKAKEALCLIQGSLILARVLKDKNVFKQQLKFIQTNYLKKN